MPENICVFGIFKQGSLGFWKSVWWVRIHTVTFLIRRVEKLNRYCIVLHETHKCVETATSFLRVQCSSGIPAKNTIKDHTGTVWVARRLTSCMVEIDLPLCDWPLQLSSRGRSLEWPCSTMKTSLSDHCHSRSHLVQHSALQKFSWGHKEDTRSHDKQWLAYGKLEFNFWQDKAIQPPTLSSANNNMPWLDTLGYIFCVQYHLLHCWPDKSCKKQRWYLTWPWDGTTKEKILSMRKKP